MATNEILQFGNTGVVGTDILSQANYDTDAQRPTGHQPGVARAQLENKVLKQTSLIAASFAQFVADFQSNNVTDLLTPSNFKNYFSAALTAGWDLPNGPNYQMLPGGLILQWGTTGNVVSDTSVSVTFDIAFPNSCKLALAIPHVSTAGYDCYAMLISKSLTGCVFARGWFTGMAAEDLPMSWLAIGG